MSSARSSALDGTPSDGSRASSRSSPALPWATPSSSSCASSRVGGSFLVTSLEEQGLSPFLLTYVCNALFVVLLPVYFGRQHYMYGGVRWEELWGGVPTSGAHPGPGPATFRRRATSTTTTTSNPPPRRTTTARDAARTPPPISTSKPSTRHPTRHPTRHVARMIPTTPSSTRPRVANAPSTPSEPPRASPPCGSSRNSRSITPRVHLRHLQLHPQHVLVRVHVRAERVVGERTVQSRTARRRVCVRARERARHARRRRRRFGYWNGEPPRTRGSGISSPSSRRRCTRGTRRVFDIIFRTIRRFRCFCFSARSGVEPGRGRRVRGLRARARVPPRPLRQPQLDRVRARGGERSVG